MNLINRALSFSSEHLIENAVICRVLGRFAYLATVWVIHITYGNLAKQGKLGHMCSFIRSQNVVCTGSSDYSVRGHKGRTFKRLPYSKNFCSIQYANNPMIPSENMKKNNARIFIPILDFGFFAKTVMSIQML